MGYALRKNGAYPIFAFCSLATAFLPHRFENKLLITTKRFHEMKKTLSLQFFGLLILLAISIRANAQITVSQNPTFTTTGQDWYKTGPGAVAPTIGKDYLFNDALKGFFDASFGVPSILEIKAKAGFALDLYSDIKTMNGGMVDINFPVKIDFTHPNHRSYGCGEEIAITSTCSVNSGYQLTSTPPIFEMELGVKAKAGAYFGYQDPFSSNGFVDLAATGQTFANANSGNYEPLMAGSESPFFGIHTQNGLKWPWQYNNDISAPSGTIPPGLPLTIPGFITNAVKLSGTIDNPFTTNPADVFMGPGNKTVMESATKKFIDIDFDPIQFQEKFTGFPLRQVVSIPGIFSFDYTLFSLPINFKVFQTQKLKFTPNVDIQMQLNRIYAWRVRDENNNIVTTGTGNSVTMKAGHTLLVTVPTDNQPIAVTPTYQLTNEFTTHIRDSVRVNVGVEVLKMKLTTQPVLLCNPFDPDECVEIIEAGEINHGPVYSQSTNVAAFGFDTYPETTFQMGGFTNIAGATFTMQPDDAPPVPTFSNPVFALDANGQFVVNSVTQVTSSIIDADNGGVVILYQPTVTYTCADLGAKTYNFSVTDNRCNGTVYSAPITIIDNLQPTVLVVAPFNLPLDATGNAVLTVNMIDNGSYDNCTIVSRTLNKYTFNCGDIGPHTITLTVADQSGNMKSLSTTVTVIDNLKPVMAVVAPFDLELDENGQASITVDDIDNGSTDNCGTFASRVLNKYDFNCSNVGPNTVTLTITDARGNVNSASVVVTVVDRRKPILSCSNQTIVFNGQTQIPLVISDLVTATDNCGVASIVLNPVVIPCAQLGSIVPVLITVTDVNNNVETCTVYITVNGLPCGWSQNPDGAGCIDGSAASYNVPTSAWGLTSEDCYYASPFNADELAFAQYQLCGNGSITAKVNNMGGSGWAGVVMRESNAAGAKKVQLMTNLGSNLTRREVRTTTNGASQPQQFPAQNRQWLRIVRSGNQFTGYASANGIQWYPEVVANVPMNSCIQIGLVTTNNHAISTVNSAFSNVSTVGSSVASLTRPDNGLPATAPTQTLSVYPNPASTEVQVELTPFLGKNIRLSVYNGLGARMLYTEIDDVQATTERLDLARLQKGLYLISVETSEGEKVSSKLVVQ